MTIIIWNLFLLKTKINKKIKIKIIETEESFILKQLCNQPGRLMFWSIEELVESTGNLDFESVINKQIRLTLINVLMYQHYIY